MKHFYSQNFAAASLNARCTALLVTELVTAVAQTELRTAPPEGNTPEQQRRVRLKQAFMSNHKQTVPCNRVELVDLFFTQKRQNGHERIPCICTCQ